MKYVLTIFLLGSLFCFPNTAFSRLGVGVGIGKIQVDEKLKPGMIYELPVLSVINTGDEASKYSVGVGYHQDQTELKPPKEWFDFSPREFYLEPGQTQVVETRLNLPLKMEPGDYFVYLEGSPMKVTERGSASVGVAAATKLYFTVEPANFFQGVYYKLISWWTVYSPWPQRIIAVIALVLVYMVVKRYFNIDIKVKNQKGNKQQRAKVKEEKMDE